MQLKHLKTLLPPLDGAAKITALAWAPNNMKLAVCTSDRIVILFDELGERRDKFATKPADAKFGKKSYMVRGLAFSPDSAKLAVAQTDNIVFIYKIGEDWSDKKVICNKFVQQSAATAVVWPSEGPLIIGLADGKVRLAQLKTNKSQTLYGSDSLVVALTVNTRGTAILSGHADGTIVRFFLAEDGSGLPQGKVCTHPVPPYALAWPSSGIFVAGCDRKVALYDGYGAVQQLFDYSNDSTEKEFTVATSNPSGQAVALGSFDRVRIFMYSPRKKQWEEAPPKDIKYLYTITALGWKRDGSKIACGTLCGSVELLESVLKKTIWKNKFELTYVGSSQVLVKPLSSGVRGVILKSRYGWEIEDVRIMGKDRYLVSRTTETMLLGDLQQNLLSEVPWGHAVGNEKFYFDNPNVCMIFNAGELSLVEYGKNEILGSVRTEFMNPHLISVRINERKQQGVEDNKKLAYLLDLKTICIMDMVLGVTLGQVSHDSKIDWLELNETGRKLLFRDKRMRLNLVDVESFSKTSILNYCTFVQWVPCSDVVVAQSRNNLCIWYNIEVPERVTMSQIRGEVVDVVREDEGGSGGGRKTEVVVQEGHHQMGYPMDEALVEFGTAVDDGDYMRAVAYLETLKDNSESEAMWRTLSRLSLEKRQLTIAERCAAALGDVAKAQYLRETIELAEGVAKATGMDGMDAPEVWARIAILEKQFKAAEGIFLDQNQIDQALEMYQRLHKWEDALALAEAKAHPNLDTLRQSYYDWLISTGQEEKAGEMKEREGDLNSALSMYLRAGLPVRAARLIQSRESLMGNPDAIQRVSAALVSGEFYEQAGQLYESVEQPQRALECYREGEAYSKAVELARYAYPTEVVTLEEEWGDHLAANKQLDAAINHYIEAGKTIKALEAAIGAGQWKKAVQIIQVIDDSTSVAKHYFKLGQHFRSVKDFTQAERFYLMGGMHKEAIDMYNEAGQWEKAHRLASRYMQSEEVSEMYVKQAEQLEQQGRFTEAEKLYASVNEPDLAITMYKKARQYDQMMRLVAQYHPELVETTHLHLAQELEGEGNHRASEQHYLAANDWKGAVNMYRGAEMWEDAYRVAKVQGGPQAGKQLAFLWARSLGGDSAVKLLTKFGLLEQCIEYACESYQFEFAFDLARTAMKHKMPDIHYKYAMALEDDGKFREAEDEFIKSGKPKEAVLMYVHNQDWENAQRVAELHDPESVSDVLVGQAKVSFQERNFPRFESLLLRAQCPELAVKYYQEAGMWPDALRLCREYLPHKMAAMQEEYDRQAPTRGGGVGPVDVDTLMSQGQEWEANGEYLRAIESYLKVTSTATDNAEVMTKAWTRAADVAVKFMDSERAAQVAQVSGSRLKQLGRIAQAANVFLAAGLNREAVDAYLSAEEWAKARKVARDLEPALEEYVEGIYKQSLKQQGRAEQLADVDLIGALDLMAEQGQWSKCIETATQHGSQVLHKYVALYGSHLVKSGNPQDAVQLYAKHGAPDLRANYNLYRRMAIDMFSLPDMNTPEAYQSWACLRDVLYDFLENLRHGGSAGGGGGKVWDEFETLLLVAHYYANRSAFRSAPQLGKLVAKVSASLLRHTDIVPVDKAFLEAGMDAKDGGVETMAFVFLNRYLDLHEAIDEGSLDMIDNSDFVNTDVPYEVPLPERPFLQGGDHEKIKDWVLTVSMDQQIEQVLPMDERGCYEASLLDPSGEKAKACVVTGYPAIKSLVQFNKKGRVANREDWNRLVMAARVGGGGSNGDDGSGSSKEASSNSSSDLKVKPLQDVLRFIGKWGGGAPDYSFN